MELETFARERQRRFFSALEEEGSPHRVAEEEEDGSEDPGPSSTSYTQTADAEEGGAKGDGEQDDMRVMKEAHRDWAEDGYYGGGNVTALVQLDEYEREDDALVITMNNIHKTYLLGVEGVPALRGVSLSVRRGEFLIIYGTSGGK